MAVSRSDSSLYMASHIISSLMSLLFLSSRYSELVRLSGYLHHTVRLLVSHPSHVSMLSDVFCGNKQLVPEVYLVRTAWRALAILRALRAILTIWLFINVKFDPYRIFGEIQTGRR